MLIPRGHVKQSPVDSIEKHLTIHLAKPGAPAILGEYTVNDEWVVFKPLIPFSGGLKYEVRYLNRTLQLLDIASPDSTEKTTVYDIYPRQDTLPENLLKIYIRFTQPMQEGVSAEHVVLIKDGRDTLKNVFLDLQPELWNHDGTMLTLWLDPGRIKRDLQPNLQLGAPLQAGGRYQIFIKPGWQDYLGIESTGTFQKDFVTVARDSISPDPEKWTFHIPRANSTHPLRVQLEESLDYSLLQSALRVIGPDGQEVPGAIQIRADESIWQFLPFSPWTKGQHKIEIESRLEDLAGNNLNRLFDTDLTKPAKANQQDVHQLSFPVR